MRILHVNLAKRGIGRYGLLNGSALACLDGTRVLSVYDAALLDNEFLRDKIAGTDYVAIEWSRLNKARGLRRLIRIAASFKPDVIHDSGGCYARSLPVWLALRRYAPLVLTEHDPVPHVGSSSSLWERATRVMMPRLMSHVFVHGPLCRELVVQRGVSPANVSIVRHGHLGMFDRGRYPEGIRRDNEILFFGELRYNKGADLLPEIANQVLRNFPSSRFIVAGSYDGSRDTNTLSAKVSRALTEMKGRPCFEVHDRFIPDDEVEYFFKRCAVTVMPYREATQSGIAMIAMPLGSIVVATEVGDIPDIVKHGVTGHLATTTPGAISDQIIKLLENHSRAAAVREAAREYVLNECTWEAVARHVGSRCEAIVSLSAPKKGTRHEMSQVRPVVK